MENIGYAKKVYAPEINFNLYFLEETFVLCFGELSFLFHELSGPSVILGFYF